MALLFFKSDTTGEKDFEEFFTDNEDLDMDRFNTVGVIRNQPHFDDAKLDEFMEGIKTLRAKTTWTKMILLNCILICYQNLPIKKLVNI